jgi:hypothetical protein
MIAIVVLVSSPTLRLGFLLKMILRLRRERREQDGFDDHFARQALMASAIDRPHPPLRQFACDPVVADGFSEHIKNGLTLIFFSFIRDDLKLL